MILSMVLMAVIYGILGIYVVELVSRKRKITNILLTVVVAGLGSDFWLELEEYE